VNTSSIAIRAAIISAVVVAMAGCGTSRSVAHASDPATSVRVASTSCAATVVSTLGKIAQRVYNEGVSSERTATAVHLIAASLPLRQAVEAGDAQATRAAERALLATGHMTNLKVMRGGHILAAVGSSHALAPLSGTLTGAAGTPIATFVASVWADNGFAAEITGIDEGELALRAGGRSVDGTFPLPHGELSAEGSLTQRHVEYRYTSFPVSVYPTGQLRTYVLRSFPSMAALCGHTREDTLVNTLSRVAESIYAAESGRRAQVEVRRVQQDPALLRAVAAREPAATRQAIESLLNHHIVRLRVSAGGALLSDVGGPYVLAPVSAPLRSGGRSIGSFVLSIQDDEGYKRLTKRLAGVDVLMYKGSELVKNSLGPNPGQVPSSGTYHYRGLTFHVYTLHAQSFPSGPLKISVLIPIPYT
jgi:hypothetical protein